MGKASEVFQDEKKKKRIVKKVVSQFYLVISIWSFPKTILDLQIAKAYFSPQVNKGESGAFVAKVGAASMIKR